MAQHIILHIEGKNNPYANKVLHYADGIVETRTPDWKTVLEVRDLGREVTMLDMEDQFLKIYEDDTPKQKAKELRKRAKELAKASGNLQQVAAIEVEEQEAAQEAAKAAKAAKARKKKASDKRSASLFQTEAQMPKEIEATKAPLADTVESDEGEPLETNVDMETDEEEELSA